MDDAPQVAPGNDQPGTRAAARRSGSGRDLDWRDSGRIEGSRQLKGRKAALVLVVVEKRGRVTGRARMAVIPDFKSATLLGFLKENVVLGSTVYTDGLKSFAGLQQAGFQHVPRPQPLRIDLRKGANGAAFGGPRHWKPPAMADRNLSRREPRSASGLSR